VNIRQKVRQETARLFDKNPIFVIAPGPWSDDRRIKMIFDGKLRFFPTISKASAFASKRGKAIRVKIASPSSPKVVYLMRGLPACGKSYRAKELAGSDGVVCETDSYFVANDGSYVYRKNELQDARDWNYAQFCDAVNRGVRPIVVDRGNGLHDETLRFVKYALAHQYRVELAEPTSPWWPKVKAAIRSGDESRIKTWARRLARKQQSTHRVSEKRILRRMKRWNPDITIENTLERI
jgi:hypothetical protein